jgi:hypothetical protein
MDLSGEGHRLIFVSCFYFNPCREFWIMAPELLFLSVGPPGNDGQAAWMTGIQAYWAPFRGGRQRCPWGEAFELLDRRLAKPTAFHFY